MIGSEFKNPPVPATTKFPPIYTPPSTCNAAVSKPFAASVVPSICTLATTFKSLLNSN